MCRLPLSVILTISCLPKISQASITLACLYIWRRRDPIESWCHQGLLPKLNSVPDQRSAFRLLTLSLWDCSAQWWGREWLCTEADEGRREIEGHGHKRRVAILFLQLSLLALQLLWDTQPMQPSFVCLSVCVSVCVCICSQICKGDREHVKIAVPSRQCNVQFPRTD